MLILLTPSKTMDFDSPLPIDIQASQPLFGSEAKEVRAAMKQLDVNGLRSAMKMSQDLAVRTQQLYADDNPPTKPALWTYVGDVYRGVQSATMTQADADWAQTHLMIASGLYGLLRPQDAVSPYRLEMAARLTIGESENLYQYWSLKLAKYIESTGTKELVVLSSDEYARAAIKNLSPSIAVYTPRFFDTKPNGVVGQVPIYNKQMRGVMARWMIDNRVEDASELVKFNQHDYVYDESRSLPKDPVFTRQVMRPLDLPSKVGLQSAR